MLQNKQSIWREGKYEGESRVKSHASRAQKARNTKAKLFKRTNFKTNHRSANVVFRFFDTGYLQANGFITAWRGEDTGKVQAAAIENINRPAQVWTTSTCEQIIPKLAGTHSFGIAVEIWIWLHSMDNWTSVRTFVHANEETIKYATNFSNSKKRGIQFWIASAYFEGQTQRKPASPSQETTGIAEKRALRPNAKYRLCFGDESSFNLYPYLTKLWHKKGQQVKVPTPGKNRKYYVFGVIEYKRGKFFYHIQDKNNQWGCMIVVQKLVTWARSMGMRVILVWDNAKTHTAKRLEKYLYQPHVRKWLKIFWLSAYSPDLNDIERLWRYLKRTGVANHLFKTFLDFKNHLISVLESVNKSRAKLPGIVFNVSPIAYG